VSDGLRRGVSLHLSSASVRASLIANLLGAAGAIAAAAFGVLLAQDSLNVVGFLPSHVGGAALGLIVAGLGGVLDRHRSAWFGWLAYGTMLPSGILVLSLGVVHIQTRTLAGADSAVFLVSLLAFAISLPATLMARRRARSRLALVQSNFRESGS
jgi:hypothetical protein